MVALCRWVPVEPSHGAGGMGTGCHPAWPQHQKSSSVTCCYGRRKGRFNLFLSHKIRRDVTSPALMTGRGGLCNTSSPHCSREPSGVKGPGEAMSSGCNGASLASGPLRHLTLSWHQGGTGHHIILVDPKGPWDPSKRERVGTRRAQQRCWGSRSSCIRVQLRGARVCPSTPSPPQPEESAEKHWLNCTSCVLCDLFWVSHGACITCQGCFTSWEVILQRIFPLLYIITWGCGNLSWGGCAWQGQRRQAGTCLGAAGGGPITERDPVVYHLPQLCLAAQPRFPRMPREWRHSSDPAWRAPTSTTSQQQWAEGSQCSTEQGHFGEVKEEPWWRLHQPDTSGSSWCFSLRLALPRPRWHGGEQMLCDSLCSWRGSSLVHASGSGEKRWPRLGPVFLLAADQWLLSGSAVLTSVSSKAALICLVSWWSVSLCMLLSS